MKARSLECRQASPISPEEVKAYEVRYYNQTGGGIVHPNEFAEMYVRKEVEKHLAKKYAKGNK